MLKCVFKWWSKQNNTATNDLKLQSYLLPEAYCTTESEDVSEDIIIFICIKEFKDWGLATRCSRNTHFVLRLNIFCRLFSSEHLFEIVKIHVLRFPVEFLLHLCSSVNTFATLLKCFEGKIYWNWKKYFPLCLCLRAEFSRGWSGNLHKMAAMFWDVRHVLTHYISWSLCLWHYWHVHSATAFSACSDISVVINVKSTMTRVVCIYTYG